MKGSLLMVAAALVVLASAQKPSDKIFGQASGGQQPTGEQKVEFTKPPEQSSEQLKNGENGKQSVSPAKQQDVQQSENDQQLQRGGVTKPTVTRDQRSLHSDFTRPDGTQWTENSGVTRPSVRRSLRFENGSKDFENGTVTRQLPNDGQQPQNGSVTRPAETQRSENGGQHLQNGGVTRPSQQGSQQPENGGQQTQNGMVTRQPNGGEQQTPNGVTKPSQQLIQNGGEKIQNASKHQAVSRTESSSQKMGGIPMPESGKEGMDMGTLTRMDPSALDSAVKGMDTSAKDDLCIKAIRGGADPAMLRRLKAMGADCMEAMRRDSSFVAKGGQAESAMKQMRDAKPDPRQWAEADWETALKQMPSAVKADDIKMMPREIMKKMVESGDMREAAKEMKRPSEKRALESQLKQAYGQPETWDKATIERIAGMMSSMSVETLDKIPKEQMRQAVGSLKDIEFDDVAKKVAAGRKVIEGLGKDRAAQWSADDVKNTFQFINKNPAIVSKLSDDALDKSMSDLGSKPTDKAGAASLGKRIKKMDAFKDPKNIDGSKIQKMGQLMKGMGEEYLKNIGKDALENAKETLANVSFARGEAKEIMDKIKGDPKSYDGNKIRQNGNLMVGLDEEDLTVIPDDAVQDAVDDLKEKDFDVSQGRILAKKMKGKKEAMKKMGKMMKKFMTVEDLKDVSIDDLDINCTSDKEPEFEPSPAQAAALFKKIKARFGAPSKSNTNYTLSCMKNWGRVAALGMEPKDFENLPDNGDLKSIAEKLAEFAPDMDDAQTKAASKRIGEYMGMANKDRLTTDEVDETAVEQLGAFFKHFSDSELNKFDKSLLPAIARKIGESKTDRMPATEIRRLKNFALKNIKRDDTNQVTDRRDAATLDDNDIRDLGNLFGGMEEYDIKKMDKMSMKNNMASLSDKVRGKGSQKALVDNMRQKTPDFLQNSENFVSIAAVAGGLEKGTLDNMDELTMGEAMIDMADKLDKKKERDQKRDKSGFSNEVNDADRRTMDSQKKNFVRRAFSGYMKNQAESGQTAPAPSCEDIKALGGNVDSLEVSMLERLDAANFKDCAETLGKVSSWSREQLSKLAEKAKTSFGQPEQWDGKVIRKVRAIAAGLSKEEIGKMELNSTSLLAEMGKSSAFSQEQLKAGFDKVKQKVFGGDATQITGDDLMSMGKFACGMDNTDVGRIQARSFRESVSAMGQLDCGDGDKRKAFASKAKEAMGDPATWDKSTVSALSEVVAGLDGDDMKKLSKDVIGSINPDVLAKVNPTALAGMSRDQLSEFSPSQLTASFDRMKDSLPSDMKSMLQGMMPKESMRREGDKQIMAGGIELDARKGGMDISQLKNFRPSDLGDAVAQMSESDRDTLCQRAIKGGADGDMLKTLKEQGADCVAAMKRDPNFKPTGGEAEVAMKQMREEKPPTQWTDSDWQVAVRQMPSAIKADDIKEMSSGTLRSLVQAGDMQTAVASMTRKSEKRAVETQIKQAFGEPDAWDTSALQSMGSLLGSMDSETLGKIRKTEMRQAAASFKNIEFDDVSKKAAAGRQLVESLGSDATAWSAEDVKNADQYIRGNPRVIRDLPDSALSSALEDLGSRETDVRGAAELGRRIKSMTEYNNPAQMDSTKVAKIGHLIKSMGKEYLKNLNTNAVSGALSTLANVSFPRGDAKELLAKVKGTPSSYTADSIRSFGKLAVGLEAEDFDAMPDSAVGDAIEDLAEMEFDVSQCRAIVKKVKASGKANLKKMGKLMEKCISPKDIEDATLDDLGLACDSDTAPSMKPDKAQAKEMMKKVRERFGAPSKTNTNYTLSCMKNWGRVAALGMEKSEFENLPDNGDLKAVFEKLAEFEEDMDDGQTKGIAKRLREYMQVDNQTAVESHDSTTIEQVGKFMKHFNDSDLEKFNKSVKADIARKIGEANQDYQPKNEKNRLKAFALKNVKRDDTNQVTDRRNVDTLDDNDIRDLGNLFGGLEEADIKKMNKSAMQSNLVTMNDKLRDKAVKKAVFENARNRDSTFFEKKENIVGAAGLVGAIPDDMLTGMNKSILAESLSDAASQMETRKQKDKKRDESGFKAEVSEADRADMDAKKGQFIEKSFQGYMEAKSSTSSTANRRKRQTASVTCSDVQVLGSNAVSLTTSQIESISNTDFTDCTETMGAITGWSTAQLSSLITRAKAVYGTPSTWSASNTKLIGTMCAGLTDTEISTLALTSASTLATMGTSTSFTSTQLKAGFARFMSQTRSNQAASVTGDDLITIGNFACGAETSHISSFTQTAFTTAASAIGQLSTCDAAQLTSYASLAKTAYGAVSTWDSARITTLGSIIAGLTSSEISALTTSQIASISTTSIAQIPATTFSSFSETQLAGFTAAQANAVTASQQSALSTVQRASLISAGATDLTTNGSPAVRLSMMSLLAAVLVALL